MIPCPKLQAWVVFGALFVNQSFWVNPLKSSKEEGTDSRHHEQLKRTRQFYCQKAEKKSEIAKKGRPPTRK